ncbi:MAG: hypothetical protein H6741_09675 [Alphaproteobacteria bacterium]|nr:hypothetical protein [Alphaproteobacteria bacterium]MCB9744042.1 hypothetical protein [Alphaproteobacteria bacterium]MCB9792980.1 hypothetical protein [Alphaproteobacteria bacterium]
MRARDINEVVDLLDELLEDPEIGRTQLGYFPALYRQVTLEVRQGCRDERFEDNERMERLDTIFANRYLAALSAWRAGRRTSRSWEIAFNYARSGSGIVLQHLMLGMNAHINLDLGVSSAEVAPGASIKALENDFNTINDVLASLLDGTQDALGDFSPLLHKLDVVARDGDEAFANFSIAKAREASWRTARSLAPVPEEYRGGLVEVLDRGVRNLGHLIARPGPLFTPVLLEVWETESRDIPAIVRRLNRISDLRSDPSAKKGGRRKPSAGKGGARLG